MFALQKVRPVTLGYKKIDIIVSCSLNLINSSLMES